jgi:phosphate transport system substrate-binding protein
MNYRVILVLFVLLTIPVHINAMEPLTISGCSVSNVGYLNDLAGEYEKRTGQTVLVRGGGSLLGLTELGGNKIDIAASCLGPTPKVSAEFKFKPIAGDALVFIVHKSNPVMNITLQNAKDIYKGKILNWKQLGGPNLPLKSFISTPEGMGGVGQSIKKYVLNGEPPMQTGNSSLQASSAAVWEQLVEKTPEGFASSGFASARKRNLKMLALNNIMPSKANIISGKYPLKRYLYLVTTSNHRPEVQQFIEFCLSKAGQKLISSYGIPNLEEIK